ncbi:MAG: hypothetical protein CXZ00_09035, partial [Acidobacteria bacterium]
MKRRLLVLPFLIFSLAIASFAAVSFSPSSLSFGSQAVGTTSAARLVTFSNSGRTSQSFGTKTIAGDYAWGGTGTCGQTLAARSSCTMSLVFKPTASGTRTGSLTVGSTVISLTGTGTTSATPVSFSPSSLSFGTQAVGSTSAVKLVTFSNSGSTSQSFGTETIAGDYAWGGTGTCGSTLAANSTCTMSLVFKPTASGTRNGSLAVGSMIVGLTGTGGTTTTPVSISTSSLANGTVSSSYSASLQATGGTSPYKWSIASGSLPAGLTLSSTGTISGSPASSGTSSFSVKVTDSAASPQSATSNLTLTIATAPSSGGSGTLSSAYSSMISDAYTSNSKYTTVRYVSPSGNDSNAGTSSSPWATLAKAASSVSGCTLVIVQPGTYTVSSGRTAKITGSGTSACH